MIPFFISVEGDLSSVQGLIYPGTDLTLTCNPPENFTWTHKVYMDTKQK